MSFSLQEENNSPTLIKLCVCFLLIVPGALQAQFISRVNGFFPKSWEGKQAMIVAKPVDGSNVIDTTTIVGRSATFTIKLAEPCPAYLWVEGNPDDIQFFIDSPQINIGVDPAAFNQPVITGSASSELWIEEFELLRNSGEPEADAQMDMYNALLNKDSLTAFRLEHRFDSLQTIERNRIAKLILNHPSLPVSWYLFVSNSFSYQQTESLFTNLNSFSMYPSYQKIAKRLTRKRLGNKAPDFSLPSENGTNITLSKLNSRYILLDFSQRFLISCQKRHIDLKRLYKKYHTFGLEIITISFEPDEKSAKEGLKEYKLPWIQVQNMMDLSKIMDEFAVEGMPDNVLLDANKIMIGRYMSVSELDEKLQQLLKK
ncbi:TlpA disulfide reductase family protein [Spirosoma foliorum]|uniref:AhpC/TSA family protein n=1 Tax=Spirosoma foliorum TaxID=2710596 RepID=A0A7G5GXQ2_9BACT|nr:TlpA disulfide reductase family protein [Spirosoma foliorum]QMW03644.1 AhpC/TSA family protein [Spirosoma foliorum]